MIIIDHDGNVEGVSISRVTYAPPPPESVLIHRYNEFIVKPSDFSKNQEGTTSVVNDILNNRLQDDGTMEFHIQ